MSNEETLYARYLSGELTPTEMNQLKQSEDWDKLQTINKITSNLSIQSMNKDKGYERLKEERIGRKKKTPYTLRKLWIAYPIAASLILLIGAYFVFDNTNEIYQADLAMTKEVILPDQSMVVLNSDSKIEYHKKRWNRDRVLSLEGEAFFKVEKGAKFTVKTDLGFIEVLGTQFNVKARNKKLSVECYEGKVKVTYNNKDAILSAQEAVTIGMDIIDRQSLAIQNPEWTRGKSKFINESLKEVFREFERQYKVNVEIEEIGDQKFTGLFVHHNMELALSQITDPFGLSVNIIDDKNQIIISK